MQLFVGTSGWAYEWNKGENFSWYKRNSGFNAVELNASFYRFPYPNMIKSWSKKGKGIHWSIKVNKSITHRHKFNEEAFEIWEKFFDAFKSMDENIDFYLFQLPPILTPNLATRIANFAQDTSLGKRFALEFRNKDWFKEKWYHWAVDNNITLVSVDCPELARKIFSVNQLIYLRMHGRSNWYKHDYSTDELKKVLKKIEQTNFKKVSVFFNNHSMLSNGREFLSLFEKK